MKVPSRSFFLKKTVFKYLQNYDLSRGSQRWNLFGFCLIQLCVTHPIASAWKVLKLRCAFMCAQSPYKAQCKRSPKVCLHSGSKTCKINLSQGIYSCWELSNLEPARPHVVVMKNLSLVPWIWCHLDKVERRLRGKIKSANSPPLPEAF